MKVGDMVRLHDGRIGIILAYHKKYDHSHTGYPWYVWANGEVRYYQTEHLELV